MKSPLKDKKETAKTEDDTLYGLLSMYKVFNTYFRILRNKENDTIALQITDNPKKWPRLDDNRYKGYKLLKRAEIGMIKLSLKYLSPEHLIEQFGPVIGLKVPQEEFTITDSLKNEGFYSIETNSKYLPEIISLVNKTVELTPKRKYELIEKCLSKDL
jgi:hypothetical protein